jgi:hypothetical protein
LGASCAEAKGSPEGGLSIGGEKIV